jgi:CheY-like chemotaxis protein
MLSKLEKKTIFIIEDEHLIACNLKVDLEEKGLFVSGIAHSGIEALEKLKEHRPGCILLDIHLKGNLDGIDLARRIKSLYSIPIIYLSGYADDSSLERAIETGACGYLVKPVNCRQLFATVLLALQQKTFHTGLHPVAA